MPVPRILTYAAIPALLLGLAAVALVSRPLWLPWFGPASTATADADHDDDHDHGPLVEAQPVRLTAQARANLRLVVKPLEVSTYWRTLQVPGLIVDRPAQSDRGVVAPVTGVVTRVHHFPGDSVQPGERLFTLKLLSESLHLSQTELFKTTKEIEIARDQKKRLSDLEGAVSGSKIIELDYQLSRLGVALQAYRTELLTRGLNPEQIDAVAAGKFVAEIEVNVPKKPAGDKGKAGDATPTFEIQELKVDLGQQVQAGQTMCLVSNHQSLYIEGRGFKQELPLLETTAREGWPVQVEFMEAGGSDWPALQQTLTVRHIANTIDPVSQTFAFYIPLTNQSRSLDRDGRTLTLWRFRPGQKVRLHIRVEKLENVLVLPADAVVRDGPEAYVFRQNGDLFDRKAVHVVYQDSRHAVLANDGSVPPGLFVAQNAAAQLNRVLKSGSGGLPPGFHMHADGSIHSNSAHK